MWILRFHLLSSKDYNKISRICKKHGFIPRKYSSVLYSKAAIKHATQKTSWRVLSREFGIDHISLYHFYENALKSGLFQEIFHMYIESRFCLYIGEKRYIESDELHNSQAILDLTKSQAESMLKGL